MFIHEAATVVHFIVDYHVQVLLGIVLRHFRERELLAFGHCSGYLVSSINGNALAVGDDCVRSSRKG